MLAVGGQSTNLATQPSFGSGGWLALMIVIIAAIAMFVLILARGVSRPGSQKTNAGL